METRAHTNKTKADADRTKIDQTKMDANNQNKSKDNEKAVTTKRKKKGKGKQVAGMLGHMLSSSEDEKEAKGRVFGSVSLDDETGQGCTEIVPGFHRHVEN